uniref:EF-hand domain-containing protein n=1 Tax=Kalanchoe fedtschenkoi TaxID=63787 RepID=A0A7N0UBL6_KALFE
MCPGAGDAAKAENPTPALKPAFDVLDADRDGRISHDDLRSFYEAFHPIADEGMIDAMISAADSNRDGFVEYEEFERVLRTRKDGSRGYGYEVVEDAFRVMDGDGDGKVGCEDLRRYLKMAGLVVSEEEIVAMVRLGGGDERGGVTCDGLRRILGFDDY